MKKNDPNPNEFTFEEKLRLIQLGQMDPKELGITQGIPIIGEGNVAGGPPITALPDQPQAPTLGPWITFEATPVPPDVRAMWAKEDAKIIPFDTEGWKEEHKNEVLVQCVLRCGNIQGRFEKLFTNESVHRGFVTMMRECATTFENLLNKMDAEQAAPKTDESNSKSQEG